MAHSRGVMLKLPAAQGEVIDYRFRDPSPIILVERTANAPNSRARQGVANVKDQVVVVRPGRRRPGRIFAGVWHGASAIPILNVLQRRNGVQ
jgi:hypothetical protein